MPALRVALGDKDRVRGPVTRENRDRPVLMLSDDVLYQGGDPTNDRAADSPDRSRQVVRGVRCLHGLACLAVKVLPVVALLGIVREIAECHVFSTATLHWPIF